MKSGGKVKQETQRQPALSIPLPFSLSKFLKAGHSDPSSGKLTAAKKSSQRLGKFHAERIEAAGRLETGLGPPTLGAHRSGLPVAATGKMGLVGSSLDRTGGRARRRGESALAFQIPIHNLFSVRIVSTQNVSGITLASPFSLETSPVHLGSGEPDWGKKEMAVSFININVNRMVRLAGRSGSLGILVARVSKWLHYGK